MKIDCFYAKDDAEARKILLNLIEEEIESSNIDRNEVYIAKSKSNTLREIDATKFLEEHDMNIVETGQVLIFPPYSKILLNLYRKFFVCIYDNHNRAHGHEKNRNDIVEHRKPDNNITAKVTQ